MMKLAQDARVNSLMSAAFRKALNAAKRLGDYVTIRFDVEMDDYVLCWGNLDKSTETLDLLEWEMGTRDAFFALKNAGVPVSAKAEKLLKEGVFV